MAQLTAFQKASVKRICRSLCDESGSRRFLLADEVGLGKTIVAHGVIEELKKRKRGLAVIYLCSNSEIAEQNQKKLCNQENIMSAMNRLTLLPVYSKKITNQRRRLQLFSFTPGTSLTIGNSTGVKEERRLLLYLISQIWCRNVHQIKWRDFFCCSADPDIWREETRYSKLKKDFCRMLTDEFKEKLKEEWDRCTFELYDSVDNKKCSLKKTLESVIDAYKTAPDDTVRINRRRIIATLRYYLAMVALDYIDPDLVILDEFQRFKTIIECKDNTIEKKLFEKKGTSVLIMSATPYKPYTLSYEEEKHYDDFIKTLSFLNNGSDCTAVKEVKIGLKKFVEKLKTGVFIKERDSELLDLKEKIEFHLKKVMCRTERNWYIEDENKGIREIPVEIQSGISPHQSELCEYISLKLFLKKKEEQDYNILDYWKSCPSIFTFMDSYYMLIKGLKKNKNRVPSTLLVPPEKLSALPHANLKFRLLFSKVFNHEPAKISNRWKYLWVKPTYTYYKDNFYSEDNGQSFPSKYLIFSHWQFVPKAISLLLSQELEQKLGCSRNKTSPLKFGQKKSFHVFNVCYPSVALAMAIDQVELATQCDSRDSDEIFKLAREKIIKLLSSANIGASETHKFPIWNIIARLEANTNYLDEIREAIRESEVESYENLSKYYRKHRSKFLDWMNAGVELVVSNDDIDTITEIALYSPAICLLRSVLSIFNYDRSVGKIISQDLINLCMNQMRNYFNKPYVQCVIHSTIKEGKYVEKLLKYCKDAHLQAVLDEYCYMLKNVLQVDTVGGLLEHVGLVLGLGSGTPNINKSSPDGTIDDEQIQKVSHFSLAFGEDVRSSDVDKREESFASRKTAIRNAFNSPFWPFVLATTSVGQEGLDFHLYCKDVIHWNLPANPVDLEQREGRLNRYNSLSIRRNIKQGYPIDGILKAYKVPHANIWDLVFAAINNDCLTMGRNTMQGLFPHWVYESEDKNNSTLNRHLMFYSGSNDMYHYLKLKEALSLYRLVFGQPRQQDILKHILKELDQSDDKSEAIKKLRMYMINLSPFEKGDAFESAEFKAREVLENNSVLSKLLEKASYIIQRRSDELTLVKRELETIIGIVKQRISGDNGLSLNRALYAVTALIYLVDPYDETYDMFEKIGLIDDTTVIKQCYEKIEAS